MSAIGRRMNNLQYLMHIRNGPGAAVLPPTVTKLYLEFAHKQNNGHVGSRRFWRDHMPSLKYHNPTVPMIVNRTRDQSVTPTLTIYMTGAAAAAAAAAAEQTPLLAAPASSKAVQKSKKTAASEPWQHIGSSSDGSTPAPPASRGETAIKINLRGVLSHEIWAQFVKKTGATPVEPSVADVEEMERLGALKAQADKDRQGQLAYREKLKEEKRMLERARQEADALKEESN